MLPGGPRSQRPCFGYGDINIYPCLCIARLNNTRGVSVPIYWEISGHAEFLQSNFRKHVSPTGSSHHTRTLQALSCRGQPNSPTEGIRETESPLNHIMYIFTVNNLREVLLHSVNEALTPLSECS